MCKEKTVTDTVAIVSGDLGHDPFAVKTFDAQVVKHLKETRRLEITKIIKGL